MAKRELYRLEQWKNGIFFVYGYTNDGSGDCINLKREDKPIQIGERVDIRFKQFVKGCDLETTVVKQAPKKANAFYVIERRTPVVRDKPEYKDGSRYLSEKLFRVVGEKDGEVEYEATVRYYRVSRKNLDICKKAEKMPKISRAEQNRNMAALNIYDSNHPGMNM